MSTNARVLRLPSSPLDSPAHWLAEATHLVNRAENTMLTVARAADTTELSEADSPRLASSRDLYVEVFGFEVALEDPVLCLQSRANPTAQVIIPPPGTTDPPPRFGIDVGEPATADAVHAEAMRRGLRIVYPLTDEPWGVRRFFVEDPSGTVVNVLAHLP
jgi:catechol 2,3-dioxygenase-like lactoylglutathione lyase family enzyme